MRAHYYVMPPHPGLLIAKTRAVLFFQPIFSRVMVSKSNFGITDGTICFLKSIQQWRAVVLGSGMGVIPIPAARLHREVQWRCLMCQPGSQGGSGSRSTSGTN